MSESELSKEELARYARHLVLPEVGVAGQRQLKQSSVLLIGLGGLGSPLATYLAAAGVGRIGLVDGDQVDFSNLQRQTIHSTNDVGRPKVDSAAATIAAINPHVRIDKFYEPFTCSNAMRVADPYDVVIDGTDNFPTRYLVNDVCVLLNKPNCYGSVFRFEGQASVFHLGDGPCYRCLYPRPPEPGTVPSCAEGGVLGVLPGLIGTIQATEAIKILTGIGDSLSGRLILFDALEMKFREVQVRRDPACPVCGDAPTIRELIDYEGFCGVPLQGSEAAKVVAQSPWDLSPQEAKTRMDANPSLVVLDVREPNEFEICNLSGKLVPLGQLDDRISELDPGAEIIVHCKLGGRSAKAVEKLREHGFQHVFNLRGGILGWGEQVDPTITKY